MKIELLTAFYGEEHLRMFGVAMRPSLDLTSNVPELLACGHEVTHRIYCTERERAALELSPWPSPWGPMVRTMIDTKILRAEATPAWNRRHVYRCFQEAILRGNLTIVCQADHVFGHGLARAVLAVQPGEYLVCGHPRISVENGLGQIPELLMGERRKVDVSMKRPAPNEALVDAFMNRFPHPMVLWGRTHADDYWRSLRRADHFEVHFKEPPPLAFWGKPDMLEPWNKPEHGTLEVLDHELADWCLARGRLKWIADSRVFFWGELTSNRIYCPTIGNDIWLESCKFFHGEPLRWFFK